MTDLKAANQMLAEAIAASCINRLIDLDAAIGDRSPEDVIAAAKKLEAYLNGEERDRPKSR